eukprot:TRINITY_DN15459_c0_g1_i1.p1 TRINITY_DN15459_c0_g1~~TRINITY_DN15459_c0_g1_i1.p1  ORF type:complete len:127 (-),score=35.38 TRINITY_DN15459_c0_g1_i1:704-1084(-)
MSMIDLLPAPSLPSHVRDLQNTNMGSNSDSNKAEQGLEAQAGGPSMKPTHSTIVYLSIAIAVVTTAAVLLCVLLGCGAKLRAPPAAARAARRRGVKEALQKSRKQSSAPLDRPPTLQAQGIEPTMV